MKNWNFNGSLKENNKRVLTEAEGSVNMISARKDPSVSFNNDNGTLKMTLNIPGGGGSGGGGETESGVGRTYVTESGCSRGEYFNVYEGRHIGNAIGKFSHAEGGNLIRENSSCWPHNNWGGRDIQIDRNKPEFKNLSSCKIFIESSIASGLNSHAEGYETAAIGDHSHAEGQDTDAKGQASHAEGRQTVAEGDYSHSEGRYTTANGNCSHAEGYYSSASGVESHAEGTSTTANGYTSHAEGGYTTVEASYSHVEGRKNTISASGCSSHVEGFNNNLKGARNHIEGMNNTIKDDNIKGSHIEGGNNQYIFGVYSHIEGYNNVGDDSYYSHIEGENNRDYGNRNHIEGYNNECDDATCCHIEGKENSTGDGASENHIEGSYNKYNYQTRSFHIEGQYNDFSYCKGPAHIEGYSNSPSMSSSHIDDIDMDSTHIQGRFAKIDETMFKTRPSFDECKDFKYADIIGGGTSGLDRKNISLLDWDGNQTIAGELYIKNSSQPLIRCLTQSEYNSLETKNPYTLYLIKEA